MRAHGLWGASSVRAIGDLTVLADGIVQWNSAAAEEWTRVRPPRWLDPRLSLVGWLLAVLAVTAAPPANDAHLCTERYPCTTAGQWLVEAGFALILIHLF